MIKVKTTKAAVLEKLNKPLSLLEISLPEKLEYGQVLVQVMYSGICGSQIGEIEGVKGNDNFLKTLYTKCSLFVSTSEYEGFGLTILEAIYFNCKILSNDISVFKKIFNNSINYYELNNLDHLIFQLQNLLINKKNYAVDHERKRVLQNNSWENAANMTKKVYEIVSNT